VNLELSLITKIEWNLDDESMCVNEQITKMACHCRSRKRWSIIKKYLLPKSNEESGNYLSIGSPINQA